MVVRCLLVDDDPSFLRAARFVLEREGLEVVAVASTGAQARDYSEQLRPDVVLLDIELGSENGFDVARDLAGPGRNGVPPVIMISSYSADDFADLMADTPALGFLGKGDLSAAAIRGMLAGRGVP
jgi:DNA-binding NarL/FixJ family response regulator